MLGLVVSVRGPVVLETLFSSPKEFHLTVVITRRHATAGSCRQYGACVIIDLYFVNKIIYL